MDHGPAPFKEGMVSQFLQHVSLQRQFERRQATWKPNMHVQPDVELYRVDPVIVGDYVPPNAENEITMECFNLKHWQLVVHQDDSGCQPPFDLDGLREELKDAREKLYDCYRGCESQFCLDSCRGLHQQDVKEILDKYRP